MSKENQGINIALLGKKNSNISDFAIHELVEGDPNLSNIDSIHFGNYGDTNQFETPTVSGIWGQAIEIFPDANLYGYINADIILLGDWVSVVLAASKVFENFVIIGKRTQAQLSYFEENLLKGSNHLDLGHPLHSPNKNTIRALASEYRSGLKDISRNPPDNIDYFFFSKNAWDIYNLKPLAWGRAFCDNYLLRKFLNKNKAPILIDASDAFGALHFMHTYTHLPKDAMHGKPIEHWGASEESDENRRLAALDGAGE